MSNTNKEIETVWFGFMAVIGFAFGAAQWIIPEEITTAEFDRAVELCKPNGGLKVIEHDMFYHDATCNNGAVFEIVVGYSNEK